MRRARRADRAEMLASSYQRIVYNYGWYLKGLVGKNQHHAKKQIVDVNQKMETVRKSRRKC